MIKFWNLYAAFYDALVLLQPYQSQIKRIQQLAQIEEGKVYLDVGCGTGYLINDKLNVIGVDRSLGMIEVALKKKRGHFFLLGDLNRQFPFKDSVFDGVVSNNVIAYLENPEATFKEIMRVSRKGAKLTFATLRKSFSAVAVLKKHFEIQRSWLQLLMYGFFICFILLLNFPIEKKLRKGIYHGFDENEIRKLLEQCGYEILKIESSYADQTVLVNARKR